jgi:hypothetical protein
MPPLLERIATKTTPRRPPIALENGDHLTTTEFLHRFEAQPEIKKVELIEGKVHMFPPLSAEHHAEPDSLFHLWLGYYAAYTPGVKCYANPTLLFDAINSPQPDGVLCTAPRRGHHVWLNEKGYLCGRPELICEVSASSASIDLHEKQHVYLRHGVPEYLVWIVGERRIRWFVLEDDRYLELKHRSGVLVSRVFPKLALDVKALLKLDGAKVLATLQRRMAK